MSMDHTQVRINELNRCRKLLDAAVTVRAGTDKGSLVYGIREASRLLGERKKELRAALGVK